jgi:hypothetical protein
MRNVMTHEPRIQHAEDLKRFIREVPDFPKPGVLFYHITTLLKEADRFFPLAVWVPQEKSSAG